MRGKRGGVECGVVGVSACPATISVLQTSLNAGIYKCHTLTGLCSPPLRTAPRRSGKGSKPRRRQRSTPAVGEGVARSYDQLSGIVCGSTSLTLSGYESSVAGAVVRLQCGRCQVSTREIRRNPEKGCEKSHPTIGGGREGVWATSRT